MNGIKLISTGSALPERVVTNADMAKIVDTNDEWIVSRTGISSRRHCSGEECHTSLCLAAARQALERSGIRPEQIGVCLVATLSQDFLTPATACVLQMELGLPEDTVCFDLNAACSGFVYGLHTAECLLAAAPRKYGLVIGCEVLSRLTDFTDRSTCVLFGDGAGAAVVEWNEAYPSLHGVLGCRGNREALMVPGVNTSIPSYIHMDGQAVFRFAVEALPHCAKEVADKAGISLDEVDRFVFHQANQRIIDFSIKKLKVDPAKCTGNISRTGNTSAASVPILLDELVSSGALTSGQKALCVGFGGGLTWAGWNWPETDKEFAMKLNELLGTEFPIIQGGMANIATGAFAAAVSNAGALGLVGSGGMDAEALRAEIRTAKSNTDKPFGVNLMLMNPHIDELAKVVVEEGVQVVTTGAGNPGKYVPAWKEAGIKVFPVVAAPILAHRLERYGIDGVIAEGTESGGHVGEMTTMALVPQVADAVSVPVIAAGGIADGRQMAAAFALGACGVQLGTCLLASEECPIHDNYKQAVIKAGANDTTVTGRTGGAPVRVLKNKMAREYLRMEKQSLPLEEMEKLTLGSLRRAVFDGDLDTGSFMAGQVAGMVKEIRPLRAIFEDLMRGCEAVVKGLNV